MQKQFSLVQRLKKTIQKIAGNYHRTLTGFSCGLSSVLWTTDVASRELHEPDFWPSTLLSRDVVCTAGENLRMTPSFHWHLATFNTSGMSE